jgi:hypothetical protein
VVEGGTEGMIKKLNASQPSHFSAELPTMMGIIRRLIRFFTLTEEDRLKSGIYVGGERHHK